MFLNFDVLTTQASTGGKKASTFVLAKGSIVPIYVTSINGDKFLKNCTQGQYLQGTLTLAKVDDMYLVY